MTDTLTAEQRSLHMAKVKAKGNKSTEQRFLLFLRSEKITGWRRQFDLPGKPDFYFPKLKMAIFLDGCFWHGCPKCYRRPKSNVDFWVRKVEQNRKRDRIVDKKLMGKGIAVLRIFEHTLRDQGATRRKCARLVEIFEATIRNNHIR